MDIDQQMVFDRLPLNGEQRKKLYDALNEERYKANCLSQSSPTPCSPAQSEKILHEDDSPILKTH